MKDIREENQTMEWAAGLPETPCPEGHAGYGKQDREQSDAAQDRPGQLRQGGESETGNQPEPRMHRQRHGQDEPQQLDKKSA